MKFTQTQLRQMSDAARSRAMYAIRSGRSGHVGIALDAAEMMTVVFAQHLRFDPKNPDWPDRDRFVLSAGHGSALLYSVLQLAGYDVIDLSAFRKLNSPLAGHPEYGLVPGVETSTGPLGQGLANAVGMALAAKIKSARAAGPESAVYCLASDGDLMEGVAQEAIAFAGQYKLDNLVVLWDSNNISIDGPALTDIDVVGRMAAAGWDTFAVDGHNPAKISQAIARAGKSKRPAFIKCRTTIGAGASNAGTAAAHALTLDAAELAALEKKFESPAGVKLWKKLLKGKPGMSHPRREGVAAEQPRGGFFISNKSGGVHDLLVSTREASGKVLEKLVPQMPVLLGGSADLTESTFARVAAHRDITPDDFSGNYIHYGVREHAMAAIMNGLCLSGFRPYGGTFLVFSDYMRAAMRLSALMKIPVIYVLSHDSVAVGEDGPTHQPVEQLAALRAMPNMNVLRPADMAEVAACWEIALSETDRPSCLVLSRQKLSPLPRPPESRIDDIKRGGYIIWPAQNPAITIIATGSEVPLAVEVAKILAARKISAGVVSMPSVERFRLQSPEYRRRMLAGKVVAIEAGATSGWYEFADAVCGIDRFGTGGPGAEVYESFGFDAAAIAKEIEGKM